MLKHLSRFFVLMLVLGFAGVRTAYAQEVVPTCTADTAPQAGTSENTLEHDGLARTYLVYVPEKYDPTQPTPLVLSLHGFTSNARQQVNISQWNPVADEHGFLVVYPQGTGFPLRWHSGQSVFESQRPVDDVGFINALLDQLIKGFCVDAARIYISGLSNGGGMSHRLACEMAERVAAIGGVAGAYHPGACEPARPVPVIAFHGTADDIVPYLGGGGRDITFPPIETWAAGWAARNGCDAEPEALAPVGVVSGVEYVNCEEDAAVMLYTIEGGGHTWPGGAELPAFIVGVTNDDVNASEMMWEFFTAHPLPVTDDLG